MFKFRKEILAGALALGLHSDSSTREDSNCSKHPVENTTIESMTPTTDNGIGNKEYIVHGEDPIALTKPELEKDNRTIKIPPDVPLINVENNALGTIAQRDMEDNFWHEEKNRQEEQNNLKRLESSDTNRIRKYGQLENLLFEMKGNWEIGRGSNNSPWDQAIALIDPQKEGVSAMLLNLNISVTEDGFIIKSVYSDKNGEPKYEEASLDNISDVQQFLEQKEEFINKIFE